MRSRLVVLHRYAGLGLAVFLLLTAVTGSVIAWQEELETWLNPDLRTVAERGEPLSPIRLAGLIESRHPEARVSYIPLATEPGKSLVFGVRPRRDAGTGEPATLDFNEVFMNPVTGEELGKRRWGQIWPLSRETLLPFLYNLHYSLSMPGEWGIWLLGAVALVWTLDCLVGFWLTLPRRSSGASGSQRGWWQRWAPAWCIRRNAGSFRLHFDLHRAFGLWTWILLFLLAFSGFALNLYGEIFFPVVSAISEPEPSPYATRGHDFRTAPREASLQEFTEVMEKAAQSATSRGWLRPVGDILHVDDYGFFRVKFFDPGHSHDGLGPDLMYFDDESLELIDARLASDGGIGDLMTQVQFPLHSGHIAGTWGRAVVSLLGLVVMLLTVTGIVIWWRKRRARSGRMQPGSSARRTPVQETTG